MPPAAAAIRLDKWLWQARFCKTRSLAAARVAEGGFRLNGAHVAKPAQPLRPGDVLTFSLGGRLRVIRVRDLGQRRGPACEAQLLYTDLDAPPPAPGPADFPAAPLD